jgi:hypothetical protein
MWLGDVLLDVTMANSSRKTSRGGIMAEIRISIGDITPDPVAEVEERSFMLMLPVGATGLKECNRTAGPTTIIGTGTQKDRGIEFDYAVVALTQTTDE